MNVSVFSFARARLLPGLLLAVVALQACSREPQAAKAAKAAKAASEASAKAEPASKAEEQAIRKALTDRLKDLPAIDEVRRTVVAGLFEVRFGGQQIIYTDASGRFLLEGSLIDTHSMTNLTEARLDALTAVSFDQLPLKDAAAIKQGDGSRRLAVFVDPNCGYCKRFERDVMALPNVTVYTFIMPILGADSVTKARNIWCSADPAKAWRAWMIDGVAAPAAREGCDASALARNAEFGRAHRITGTPGLVFADGAKRTGAMSLPQLEAQMAASAKKPS